MTLQNKLAVAFALVVFAVIVPGGIQAYLSSQKIEVIERATVDEEPLLKQVFPQAAIFSAKSGEYLHYKAYETDPETGANTLLGFVFLTTDIVPDERAYGGPIEILAGMTVYGVITGIHLVRHREPWGPFSIERPDFAPQFVGKSILDPFEVGNDIDAITRVTITLDGATRAIRKSARQIARQCRP